MKKRTLPILLLATLLLTGCGKETTTSVAATEAQTSSTEASVSTETETETPSTETSTEPSEKEFIIGTWMKQDEDEEIISLTFSEDTYTYDFDYSRAYEPGEEIDEDPVSGTSSPKPYFLDTEYVIELEDTVLTQINMSMDETLADYGNCGIYDSSADAIYIGESFNNLLVRFVQQEHNTEAEWQEYIEDEDHLTFVRE